jgi:simple sugar transport system ATP-binding protein
LTKHFGGVYANRSVSLDIASGEIHCLLGENGAGKTTFAECLYGFYKPDAGKIVFKDKHVTIQSPSDAIRLGIGMVHQHFVLIRPLSVIENIIVGTDAAKPILDLNAARDRVQALCDEYSINLDLSAKIWQLSVGEQQWVEILKSLFGGVELLILDEPTAVLTPQEADKLFAILQKMKSESISIIFITHKLREVMQVSDRVTVLRKGEKIATVVTSAVEKSELARMMVGRDVVFRLEKEEACPGDPVLDIIDLHILDDREQESVRGISLCVQKGEIVGIAGISGNGQRELFESIVGVRHPISGRILLEGVDTTRFNPEQIARKGMAHIPEDRLSEGLIPEFSVAENLILGLHKRRFFWHGIYLDEGEVESFANTCVEEFEILTQSLRQITKNLSGGNLQKVIIARELSTHPVCLIANQPTRGLDVGAIEYVHNRLIEQRDQGLAVLLFSEDLEEILNLADRVAIIFNGKIVAVLNTSDTTREEIGLLMAGALEKAE